MAIAIKFQDMVGLGELMVTLTPASPGWGASRARIAQIMHLPNVPPEIQASSCSRLNSYPGSGGCERLG